MTFQSGLTSNEVGFDEKENERAMRWANRKTIIENKERENKKELVKIETDEAEPLRMEHFHLPLGIWMVGIVISLLFFIAEIIKHRWGGH